MRANFNRGIVHTSSFRLSQGKVDGTGVVDLPSPLAFAANLTEPRATGRLSLAERVDFTARERPLRGRRNREPKSAAFDRELVVGGRKERFATEEQGNHPGAD